MYKNPEYENSGDFDTVVVVLHRLFEPFKASFYREIQAEDFKKLIDKPMSSITRFDVKKADDMMKALEDEMKQVRSHLRHLTDYTIAWFEKIKAKYGKGRERKTEIRLFDRVEAAKVALANVKLYMNPEDGFIGTGLKKDTYIGDCSDIDEIIVFREDGRFIVTKVADKTFVGKHIIHAQVFTKGDERTVYNMIYKDGASGISYIKRFSVLGVTRDKEYDLTKGTKGSKVLYFTANPNGEAEVVTVQLKPHSKLKKLNIDIDFANIAIKGRGSMGNIVVKFPVKKVLLKSKGVSTLAGIKIWYDDILKRLNVDGRGRYLGEFDGDDKILQVYANGTYELSTFELSNHFDEGIVLMQKFDPEHVYGVVHYDGKAKNYFVKRFVFEAQPIGKLVSFISEENGSKMVFITGKPDAKLTVDVEKGKTKIPETLELELAGLIDVKGWKANGNRLTPHVVKKVVLVDAELEIGMDELDEPDSDIPVADSDPDNNDTEPGQGAEAAQETEADAAKPNAKDDSTPEAAKDESTLEVKKAKPAFKSAAKPAAEEPVKQAKPAPPSNAAEEPQVQKKKISFEITNPGDIKIDDKGQGSLF
jgi:topoisomerase-4 subunit A